MHKQAKIRLFVKDKISAKAEFDLSEGQRHYLYNVMKKEAGEQLYCLDNATGEYLCEITLLDKKKCRVKALEKSRDFNSSPDIWLLFAPVKKDNTDFIIQKATELGARLIMPVITDRTTAATVRIDRFVLQSVEAAEQCRRLDLPLIKDITPLKDVLSKWDNDRVMFFMNEDENANDIYSVFAQKELKGKKAAILIGPEGGFSEDEALELCRCEFVKSISMGGRILRAETAAAASLACWQAMLGDWKETRCL